MGSSAFLLEWKPPLETNGVLTGYKIYYQVVEGTNFGELQERSPQINDPNKNRAKLAALQTGTNYRITINATTRAGQGKPLVFYYLPPISSVLNGNWMSSLMCFRYWIEKRTQGNSVSSPAKPDFQHYMIETSMYATVKIQWYPCGLNNDCNDKSAGSHFYVKFR